MGLSTFCGLLTIQVGVTVLAAVFLTLGAVILVANILEGSDDEEGGGGGGGGGKGDEESSMNFPIIFIIAFAIGLFVIGVLAFFSAYTENRPLAMLALLVLILFTTFWIILSLLSFFGKKETIETVCRTPLEAKKALRCPESLWLADLDYKKEGGGGKRRRRREISHITEDFVGSKLMSQMSFTAEIHQILIELEKLNLCLNSCCEENCLKNRKEDNSYCNFSSIINSKLLKTGFVESNKPSKKIVPTAKGSNELSFNFLQKYLLPAFFGKLLTSTLGGTVAPDAFLPLQLDMKVENKNNSTDETKQNNENNKNEDNKYEEINVAGDKESKFKFGKPMIAAVGLFIANLAFFLFSMLMLWSWAQELGDDCYIDEIYYF